MVFIINKQNILWYNKLFLNLHTYLLFPSRNMPFHSSFVIKQLVHLLAVEMVFVYFVAKVKVYLPLLFVIFQKDFYHLK
jgi:hypothetical protein